MAMQALGNFHEKMTVENLFKKVLDFKDEIRDDIIHVSPDIQNLLMQSDLFVEPNKILPLHLEKAEKKNKSTSPIIGMIFGLYVVGGSTIQGISWEQATDKYTKSTGDGIAVLADLEGL